MRRTLRRTPKTGNLKLMDFAGLQMRRVATCVLLLALAACATVPYHPMHAAAATPVVTDEMLYDRIPVHAGAPTVVVEPATATCHITGHPADIVCPLMAVDDTYYATIQRQGADKQAAEAVAVQPPAGASTTQLATDD